MGLRAKSQGVCELLKVRGELEEFVSQAGVVDLTAASENMGYAPHSVFEAAKSLEGDQVASIDGGYLKSTQAPLSASSLPRTRDLLDIVESNSKITVSRAGYLLRAPRELVLEWANSLMLCGLVDVKHGLFGENSITARRSELVRKKIRDRVAGYRGKDRIIHTDADYLLEFAHHHEGVSLSFASKELDLGEADLKFLAELMGECVSLEYGVLPFSSAVLKANSKPPEHDVFEDVCALESYECFCGCIPFKVRVVEDGDRKIYDVAQPLVGEGTLKVLDGLSDLVLEKMRSESEESGQDYVLRLSELACECLGVLPWEGQVLAEMKSLTVFGSGAIEYPLSDPHVTDISASSDGYVKVRHRLYGWLDTSMDVCCIESEKTQVSDSVWVLSKKDPDPRPLPELSDPDVASLLFTAAKAGLCIAVTGASQRDRTDFLNSLARTIEPRKRVFCLEHSRRISAPSGCESDWTSLCIDEVDDRFSSCIGASDMVEVADKMLAEAIIVAEMEFSDTASVVSSMADGKMVFLGVGSRGADDLRHKMSTELDYKSDLQHLHIILTLSREGGGFTVSSVDEVCAGVAGKGTTLNQLYRLHGSKGYEKASEPQRFLDAVKEKTGTPKYRISERMSELSSDLSKASGESVERVFRDHHLKWSSID